jgi:hypothetical protein
MMVSCGQQQLGDVLAGAKSALKDEANAFNAKFIEAQWRSLTALVAPVTPSASNESRRERHEAR